MEKSNNGIMNRRNIKLELGLLIAIITAFLSHGQFEAWWTGVGSVQLPLFFMYFGLSVAAISNPYSKYIMGISD